MWRQLDLRAQRFLLFLNNIGGKEMKTVSL